MISALIVAAGLLSGTLEGRVTSEANGTPVVGATIAIATVEASALSAPDGSYSLSLPEGRWAVHVSAPGYVARELVVHVSDGGTTTVDVELAPVPRAAESGWREPGAVGGRVLEEERGEPVPGARLELVEVERATDADAEGVFAMADVPAGTWTLRVTAPGYHPRERRVRVEGSERTTVALSLEPDPVQVTGVVVRGWRPPTLTELARIEAPGARVVDTTAVARIPTVVERDVLRALHSLPSASASSDYSSALFVRGGTPDQTRIFLDGVQLHNPYHVGGFVSTFTPDATTGALLRPGGIPASVPSSLSGAAEIRTREAGRDSLRVRGGIGLLSSSATVDGPLPADLGTLLVSGRRTYIDAVTGAAHRLGLLDQSLPYSFDDALAKLAIDAGRGRVTASAYVNRERLSLSTGADEEEVLGRWGSDALSFRLDRPVGLDGALELGIASSGFDGRYFRRDATRTFEIPISTPPDTSRHRASVRTLAAHGAWTEVVGAHRPSFGVRWESTLADHRFSPLSGDDDLLATFQHRGRYGTTALFVRDRWAVDDSWTVDAGVRAEYVHGRGAWHTLPRARLERSFGAGYLVALSGGRYVQPWWSLRNEESTYASVMAYDVAVPVRSAEPISTGWDAVLEGRARLGGMSVRADAFVKRLSDIPVSQPTDEPWRSRVLLAPHDIRLGSGRVHGLELSAEGRVGGTDLMLAYRWQRETRRLGSLSFTPRSERRHRLTVNGARAWGERQIAFALTWMSGIPFTPVFTVLPSVGGVDSQGRPFGHAFFGSKVVRGVPNSARLPSYLRLDVSARGLWDLTLFGRRGVLQPYVSVLNVFNHHNGLVADHTAFSGRVLREVFPQLPVLPSFGLRWRF